jgi:hypothetical protein
MLQPSQPVRHVPQLAAGKCDVAQLPAAGQHSHGCLGPQQRAACDRARLDADTLQQRQICKRLWQQRHAKALD